MPFFIQHLTNPYLYNPAFAGYDKHAVLSLTHHQQWIGIEGAPSSIGLTFHTPAGHANPYSFGADIFHDKIGILNSTTLRTTFGYLVPFGVEREHYLRFGLSGGLGSQHFDLSDVQIEDDRVLQNVLNRSIYLDGRFGLHYHLENLNLGFALPHIFSNPMMNPDGTNITQISALNRFIASASYRISLSPEGSMALEPTVLYNISRETDHQLEAFGVFHFKDAFWVGGGYQQQAGIAGLMGLKVKNLKIGYAYGFGGSTLAGISSGTHEAQLSLYLGKKREVMKRKPRLSTTANGDKIPDAALQAAQKKARKKKETAVAPDRKKVTPQQQTQPAPAQQQPLQNAVAMPVEQAKPAEKETAPPPTSKPVPKVDYSELSFESIEQEKTEVVRLGKETKPEKAAETAEKSSSHRAANTGDQKKNIATAAKIQETATPSRVVKVAPSKSTDHPLALQEGKYIVAGTFSQESNAEKLIQKLQAAGYAAKLGYHTEKKFYYVHVMSSHDVNLLKNKLQELQQHAFFTNAWILSVEP